MRKIETKKLAAAVTALALCAGVLTGCGGAASSTASSTAASSASSEASSEEADEMAAKNVADLIDAIYVQERNEDTDAQCEAAKAAWDALTDTQKELVEGENADPDYFGRDTGDASKDDARNQDDIGDNELLVVSFGTSFNDSRVKDIKGIEDALQAAYPDWSVRRAFTAQIIINHVQARDGEKIDNMQQAMDRAVENGVKNLVVQPTHLMHGAEYDEMMEMIDTYRDKFESVAVAEPLLGEVGSDATIINQDKEDVAKAVTAAAVKEAGYDSLDAAAADKVAFVFMGHGTSHTAKVSYSQMQTTMQTLGYDNVFIGTVEGKPEETACENVIEAVKAAGYTKVILRPLMVVAGDHANNDMAGEDADSWLSQFKASGAFDSIDCQIAGLGEIEDVQKLYVAHTNMGYPLIGRFAKDFKRYAKDHGITLSSEQLFLPQSREQALDFILPALKEDHPVAFLILRHPAHELREDNWHWVTITGFDEEEEKLIWSNCGECEEIDWNMLFDTDKKYYVGIVKFKEEE